MTEAEKKIILDTCNASCPNTLMETLEISYCDVDDDVLVAKMPVNSRVHQPDGVLHGGAMVALAESVGSVAAYIFVDRTKYIIRGLEISANHVKSARNGFVYGTATPIHKGRTTQLWQIKITNEEGKLISMVKLTTIAIPKK